MDLKQTIADFVAETLKDPQYYVVAVNIRGNAQGAQKITVLLDGDKGIGIDTCAEVSRALGQFLDEKDLITAAYLLEVSSPGIDYPLSGTRQYLKNIGRELKVQLKDGKEITGILIAVVGENIALDVTIKEKGKKARIETQAISLDEVVKAVVQISFK